MAVKNVKIFNRDGSECDNRLSWAIVSIIDSAGNTLSSYNVGDTNGKAEIDISVGFNNVETSVVAWKPPLLTRQVRIELGNWGLLHVREVQVFDYNNVNRALRVGTSQSPTDPSYPSSNAVDGSLDTFSHTADGATGKYHHTFGLQISSP